MNQRPGISINRLPTGVPGLDQVLGGGIPELSFNLIGGAPGTGKTVLAHQIVFANASTERRALYLTVLGEPAVKMLRYQQQFTFFDPDKVDGTVRFVNLNREVLSRDLGGLLEAIVRRVEESRPALVVVDSFRALTRTTFESGGQLASEEFLQQLSIHLATWEATTFLVGDYPCEDEMRDTPILTMADGILWLYQRVERNSMVRRLEVRKIRGQNPMPGLHTLRISEDGIEVFPRMPGRIQEGERRLPRPRISTGVPGLDEMLGGGIPSGDSVLVAGPAGSGKTVLGTQFIATGVRQGEAGVIVVFEERPREYLERAREMGFDLESMAREGKLAVIYLRPLDLSVEETLHEIQRAVERTGARRVLIDSISGFELALAPTFREDCRESLYRLVNALTGSGITVLLTVELADGFTELRFSPHAISFLTDDIILQRYVEMEGEIRKVMAVVKMRSSQHSRELRAYEITPRGLVVGEPLKEYRGLILGVPTIERRRLRRPPRGRTTE